MIHFKYRKTRTMAYLIDGFDAPLERAGSMSRIPREGVCIDQEKGGKAGNATLEVGLSNPILEAGFEIICSPTSNEGSLAAVKSALQVCQVELHPFFIYGHDGQTPLTEQVMIPTPTPPSVLLLFALHLPHGPCPSPNPFHTHLLTMSENIKMTLSVCVCVCLFVCVCVWCMCGVCVWCMCGVCVCGVCVGCVYVCAYVCASFKC